MPGSNENDNNEKQFWQKIDETKKEVFSQNLEIALAKLDLEKGPEEILLYLTTATKSTINACFPPKPISNRGKEG